MGGVAGGVGGGVFVDLVYYDGSFDGDVGVKSGDDGCGGGVLWREGVHRVQNKERWQN